MRLRKFIPFVSLIVVLLFAACAPVTPVIPQTGPSGQGAGTVTPGNSGQGDTGGTGGSGSSQGGLSSGTAGTDGTVANQDSQTGGTGSAGQTGGTGSSGGLKNGNQGAINGGSTAPSPSGSQVEMGQDLQDAISSFAGEQFGGNSSDFEIVWAQQVDFPNGCLGVASQGETCSQAITPGWEAVVRSNGNLYVVNTNSSGSNVRWNQNADPDALIGTGSGTGGSGSNGSSQGGSTGGNTGGTGSNQDGNTGGSQGGSTGGSTGGTGETGGSQGRSSQGGGVGDSGLRISLDQVINLASQFLGQTLNVPLNQISFSGVSVENWPDSCLGVGQANESCAQVTTPGYRLQLSVGGQSYELRTNSTGSTIRLVQSGQQ